MSSLYNESACHINDFLSINEKRNQSNKCIFQEKMQAKKSLKIQNLQKKFIQKLKINVGSRKSYQKMLYLKNKSQLMSLFELNIEIKGWEYSNFTKFTLLLINNLSIVILSFYSTPAAFITNFYMQQKNYNHKSTIIFKFFSLVGFILSILHYLTSASQQNKYFKTIKQIGNWNLHQVNFYIYLITIVGLILFIIFPHYRQIGIITYILSIINIKLIKDNLQQMGQIINSQTKKVIFFWRLTIIVTSCILIAHYVASILLAMTYIDTQRNWLYLNTKFTGSKIGNSQWYVIYIWAYYWAANIITTIGFGDFSATTQQQAAVLSFLQLVTVIILAYTIGRIGLLIAAMNQQDNELINDIGVLKRFSKQYKINQSLVDKIQEYIRFRKQNDKFQYFQDAQQLINRFSPILKEKYYKQTRKHYLRQTSIFKYFQQRTLLTISEYMKVKTYYSDYYLFTRQNYLQSIAILLKGDIGLVYNRGKNHQGSVMTTIKVQDQQPPVLLNANMLTKNTQLDYDMITLSKIIYAEISYQDFYSSLKNHRYDFQYFFALAHKQQILQEQVIQQKCKYCLPVLAKHTIFHCPRLHYIPVKSIIMLKYISKNKKNQRRYQQRYKKRNNSLKLRKLFSQLEFQKNVQQKKCMIDFLRSSIRYSNNILKSQQKNSQSKENKQLNEIFNFQKKNSQKYKSGQKNLNNIKPLIDQQQSLYQISQNQLNNKYYYTQIENSFKNLIENHCQQNNQQLIFQVDQLKNYTFYNPNYNSDKVIMYKNNPRISKTIKKPYSVEKRANEGNRVIN